MPGRLEMPNGRGGYGSRARFFEEEAATLQRTGLVEKRDSRHPAEAVAGTTIASLALPRMRSVGPGIAAGREYAREAGDVRTMSRLDRAAGLRRQWLTGTTPFTPRAVQRRPGLAALGGLALIAHSRRRRNG